METIQTNTLENTVTPDLSILCDIQLLENLDELPSLEDIEKQGLKVEIGLQTQLLGVEELIPPILIVLRDAAFAILSSTAGSALWEQLKPIIQKIQTPNPAQSAKKDFPANQNEKDEIRIKVIFRPHETEVTVDILDFNKRELPSIIEQIIRLHDHARQDTRKGRRN